MHTSVHIFLLQAYANLNSVPQNFTYSRSLSLFFFFFFFYCNIHSDAKQDKMHTRATPQNTDSYS